MRLTIYKEVAVLWLAQYSGVLFQGCGGRQSCIVSHCGSKQGRSLDGLFHSG